MATIYEAVDLLTERVTALEGQMTTVNTQIAGMGVTVLEANTDLNTLGVGKYYIPSATVCGTLLNKPTTSNDTGFVEVVKGGDAGQVSMYYMPCDKTTPSYYHRAYYQSEWGPWNTINLYDSGWVDLTLNDGITAYSDTQKPRYRRVGNEVFITGVISGLTVKDTTIATLPNGFRPSKRVIIATGAVGQMIDKFSVDTTGTIVYNRSSIEPVIAENWHSIACSFNVD